MKRLLPILLTVLAICIGCSNSELLTPREFTEEMADITRRGSPDWKVEIVEDLQLKVTLPGNRDGGSQFLQNAYDEYKHDPNGKSGIMHRYAQGLRSSIATMEEPVDSSRLVPVIKDRPWLTELQQSIVERGQT